MSITKMNIIDIMSESVKGEVNTDNVLVEQLASSITDKIELCETMSVPFKYSPEMVPVIFDEAAGRYYVEYDMLRKLVESEQEYGDEIEIITKYGKLEFKPTKDVEDFIEDQGKVEEDDNEEEKEVIQEEEPEKNDEEVEGTVEGCFNTKIYGHAERDALQAIILANMPSDPNLEDMCHKDPDCEDEHDHEECCPKMTMENTYVVIESSEELQEYLEEVCKTSKCGGVALINGKAKLKKADEVFENLYNQGIKVVKKK